VLLLILLTAAAIVASVGVAMRFGCSGRSELFVVTSLSLWTLLAAPVTVLGYSNALTAPRLAVSALTLFVAVFALTARGQQGALVHLRACANAAAAMARMPIDGLRLAWRGRSVVVLGLAFCAALFALGLVLTVLVPFASWDGFFYHEPIVGYAIQNHGFAIVELPRNFNVQAINGYPRLCEIVSLWFVIFSDKTLIELPNTVAAAPLMLSMYALARRFTDRVTSMGWGVVLLLVPHVWHQLCSTYIDVQVGFFLLAGMFFASRPNYRVRDAVAASLAVILVIASKASWPVLVAAIVAVAYGRLLVIHARARALAAGATIACGLLAMGAVAAATLLRNLWVFEDPFWPITFEWPSLHLAWPGLQTIDYIHNPPLSELARDAYDNPKGGWDDIFHRAFGLAVPWVVLPVSVGGFVAAAPAALAQMLRARGEKRPALDLWLAAFPGLVALRLSPSLEQARYNIHLIAALCLGCAWALRRPRWRSFREGVIGASVVLSIIPFNWVRDALPAPLPAIVQHLEHPFASHAYDAHPTFDLLAREREEELRSGDVVVYTADLAFVGAAWNFQMSNRVEYVPYSDPEQFESHLRRSRPKWVIVGGGSAARDDLLRAGGWQLVGTLTDGFDAVALRRTAPWPRSP
jgi:hypothetical protein